jgi:sRNA-binding carbon storage regulator CsrA
MESRKITIVSTKTQSTKVIMSGAETLAELKTDLLNAGIDFTNMAFYEGTSKTELKSDDSILPKDVPYTNRRTGETIITNELVFMLTNVNKKIASGTCKKLTMSRADVYKAIKENNLQDLCKEKLGKNFTQCSTADLQNIVMQYSSPQMPSPKHELNYTKEDHSCGSDFDIDSTSVRSGADEVVVRLVRILYNQDIINDEQFDIFCKLLGLPVEESVESSYSQEDIDEMFDF